MKAACTRLAILTYLVLLSACAGTVNGTHGLITELPAHDRSFLYFQGLSSPCQDERHARQQAWDAAVAEISKYIGVEVSSSTMDVQTLEDEKYNQTIEISVMVKGTPIVAKRVSVMDSRCGRDSSGHVCGVQIKYPREEYIELVQSIAAAEKAYDLRQGQSAESALVAYDRGRQLETAVQWCPAMWKYIDAATALKDIVQPRLLADSRFANTDLLSREVSGRLVAAGKLCPDSEKWIAVRIAVSVEGVPSEGDRQALFARVTGVAEKLGYVTNLESISSDDAAKCLNGDRDAIMKAAGPSRHLLVIKADSSISSDRFKMIFYATADADWTLVDPSTGAVIDHGSSRDISGSAVNDEDACVNALDELWFPKESDKRAGCMQERLGGAFSKIRK